VDIKKAEKKGVPSKTEKKIVSSSVKDPLSAMLDPLNLSWDYFFYHRNIRIMFYLCYLYLFTHAGVKNDFHIRRCSFNANMTQDTNGNQN
jgi:hypothetical protein